MLSTVSTPLMTTMTYFYEEIQEHKIWGWGSVGNPAAAGRTTCSKMSAMSVDVRSRAKIATREGS